MREWSVAERQAIARLKFKYLIECKQEAARERSTTPALSEAERVYLEIYDAEVERADLERICARLATENDDPDQVISALRASVL